MISKIDLIKFFSGFILGGMVIFFLLKENKEEATAEVPVNIEFKTPEIVVKKDTVFLPEPIYIKGDKEIDSTYYNEYINLKDSIAKEELFKETISINVYNEVIEDDVLKIDLYMKSRGKVLEYKTDYKIFSKTYSIDTTLTIKIPQKAKLYVGGQIILPANTGNMQPSLAPSMLFTDKKSKKAYTISYDFVNKNFETGLYFRL